MLGRMEREGTRLHHTPQKHVRFKTYEWFISRIFHLLYLDCSQMQVNETTESETMDKGELLYILTILLLLENEIVKKNLPPFTNLSFAHKLSLIHI